MRANFRHLYADILWWGILAGSTIAFLAIYATRLGANSFQISLLTAGPAIVNLIFSLPSARLLEGRPLVRATFWSAFLYRIGYLALIPLPWLLGYSGQVQAVIWITVLMSIPGTLLAISFNAMFADVVPPDWRAEVVGRRNALLAVSMTITTLVCGQLLDRIRPLTNYQVVFTIGLIGAMMSTYHLWRLFPPRQPQVRAGKPLGDFARPGEARPLSILRPTPGLRFLTRANASTLLRFDLIRGAFGKFLVAYLVFYVFQYLSLVLFPLYYVNELHLTDGAISLGSSLFYGVMLVVSLRLGRITARYGHHRLLTAGALMFSVYPLLISQAANATLYWIASFLGGGIWAITNAGLVNRLMEKVPEDNRPAYMALHNFTLNLGILVGSLTGPLLAGKIGLQEALLAGAALRLVAGVLIAFWG